MNRLLSITLLTLCTTHLLCNDGQSEFSRETEQSETIISRNKEIEQEIAEFDSFINEHKDEFADSTGIIQVRVLIYKDQARHNKQDWKNLILRTAQSYIKMRRLELCNDTIINIQEEIESIIKNLENKNDDNGIITEFNIQTSDGIPTKGCCGDRCRCVEQYRGNCPCSLDNNINRCLFPQEELPFDDNYQEEGETTTPDSTSEDTPEISESTDQDDPFVEIDLNGAGSINKNLTAKKTCCCT